MISFNHLITAMKTPALIAATERDLAAGHAAVIQIVSTGEALMERRLSEIPTEEWGDVQVDITPREYVLSRYLDKTYSMELPVIPSSDGELPVRRNKTLWLLDIIFSMRDGPSASMSRRD